MTDENLDGVFALSCVAICFGWLPVKSQLARRKGEGGGSVTNAVPVRYLPVAENNRLCKPSDKLRCSAVLLLVLAYSRHLTAISEYRVAFNKSQIEDKTTPSYSQSQLQVEKIKKKTGIVLYSILYMSIKNLQVLNYLFVLCWPKSRYCTSNIFEKKVKSSIMIFKNDLIQLHVILESSFFIDINMFYIT
jgi:hypothetical protein